MITCLFKHQAARWNTTGIKNAIQRLSPALSSSPNKPRRRENKRSKDRSNGGPSKRSKKKGRADGAISDVARIYRLLEQRKQPDPCTSCALLLEKCYHISTGVSSRAIVDAVSAVKTIGRVFLSCTSTCCHSLVVLRRFDSVDDAPAAILLHLTRLRLADNKLHS